MKKTLIAVLAVGLSLFGGIGFANASITNSTVPEPSTIYLLGAGVVGLIGWGLRKKK